ncbi:hypothetical protein RB653_001596 [Dictyostelium firmibasis]|uniref:FAD-binding PCMH-type domain-containing protein n=1 Tax=Dictyostelium firmibasis TaxID=79012 RepID=A0AAN7U4C0_9MYCE
MIDLNNVDELQINKDHQIKFKHFRKTIQGQTFMKDDTDYEKVCGDRWDLNVVNTPIIIVKALNENDVKETIKFSRDNKLKVVVKTTGHNNNSVTDGGVLLDLSLMKSISVNPNNQTVTVGGGCTLHDVDEATSKYGLATPLGQISSVGIGGFSSGGGFGHLTKLHGLSCDNLLECIIITADGESKLCNNETNQDLFWAIRGAGGFVGVIVSFTFKCYPISNVVVGTFIYNIDGTNNAKNALIEVGTRHLNTSDPLVYAININPGLPDHVMVKVLYFGDSSIGESLVQQFQNSTNPTTSSISIDTPFTKIQWEFDGIIAPGKYYQEGPLLKSTITPAIADALLQTISTRNTQTFSSIIVTELGGKVNMVHQNETAFPVRNSTFNIFISSVIFTPNLEQPLKEWTKNSINLFKDYIAGEYINTSYSTDMKLIFKENFDRLIKVKDQYDPNNIFRSLK